MLNMFGRDGSLIRYIMAQHVIDNDANKEWLCETNRLLENLKFCRDAEYTPVGYGVSKNLVRAAMVYFLINREVKCRYYDCFIDPNQLILNERSNISLILDTYTDLGYFDKMNIMGIVDPTTTNASTDWNLSKLVEACELGPLNLKYRLSKIDTSNEQELIEIMDEFNHYNDHMDTTTHCFNDMIDEQREALIDLDTLRNYASSNKE